MSISSSFHSRKLRAKLCRPTWGPLARRTRFGSVQNLAFSRRSCAKRSRTPVSNCVTGRRLRNAAALEARRARLDIAVELIQLAEISCRWMNGRSARRAPTRVPPSVKVAINLSPIQFQNVGNPWTVARTRRAHIHGRFRHGLLELELSFAALDEKLQKTAVERSGASCQRRTRKVRRC
jgi:hypothetical protein